MFSVLVAFVRFSVIMVIHFEPTFLPSVFLLLCSTTSVRLGGLISTFPPPVWSAHVPHILTSSDVLVRHYYSFHRVLFPSSKSLGSIIDASRVAVFMRRFIYFCYRGSRILAYLFSQGFRWALDSSSDAFKQLLMCRNCTFSTIWVPLIAPLGPI